MRRAALLALGGGREGGRGEEEVEVLAPFLPAMAQCLQDEDEDVREACSAVLASFPPSLGLIPFQEQLVRCACRDRAPLVRVAAMRALAPFPPENFVLMVRDGGACDGVCSREGLVKRLEDEGREMRLTVVRLLARLPMEALRPFIPELKRTVEEGVESVLEVRRQVLDLLDGGCSG